MEVIGTSATRGSLRQSRPRGLTFADALENEIDKHDEETGALEADAEAASTQAAGVTNEKMETLGSTEDVMEEFLHDDDMLNLEVRCAKWRGLDEVDLEGLGIPTDAINELMLGDKHIQEFLDYRRQLNEKHLRKTEQDRIMKNITAKMTKRSAVNTEDGDESDLEDRDEDEADDHLAPLPSSSQRRATVRELSPSQDKNPAAVATNTASSSTKRQSMVSPEKRLTRVGAQIVSQEEARTEGVAKKPLPLLARRSSVVKQLSVERFGQDSPTEPDSGRQARSKRSGTAKRVTVVDPAP
jgi:hypothetical protein